MHSWTCSPENRSATHANWRQHPHNKWAFINVRQILTTACIDRRAGDYLRLPEDLQDLSGLTFATSDGPVSVEKALSASDTDAFLVIKNGVIVTERYFNGMQPGSRHIMFSVSKSILGMLFGIMADRGLVDVSRPVTHYVPELGGTAYEFATVQHVLDMAVAVGFQENYEQLDGDVARYRRASGFDPALSPPETETTRTILATFPRGLGEHGHTFHYVSPNTDVLGWIAERATGLSYADVIAELLWKPMGAEFAADMTVDKFGVARSAGGLCATLRDIGRTALLMTGHPALAGVLPEAFVEDTFDNGDARAWARGPFSAYLPGGRYRNQWYVKAGAERAALAIGIHGQWIYVNPDRNVAIVKQSSQPKPSQSATDQMLMACFDAIALSLG